MESFHDFPDHVSDQEPANLSIPDMVLVFDQIIAQLDVFLVFVRGEVLHHLHVLLCVKLQVVLGCFFDCRQSRLEYLQLSNHKIEEVLVDLREAQVRRHILLAGGGSPVHVASPVHFLLVKPSDQLLTTEQGVQLHLR